MHGMALAGKGTNLAHVTAKGVIKGQTGFVLKTLGRSSNMAPLPIVDHVLGVRYNYTACQCMLYMLLSAAVTHIADVSVSY